MIRLERLADTHNATGEGPLWHPEENCLYWVDIPRGFLYRYDPSENKYVRAYATEDGSPIGGFTIEADGALLLFGDGHIRRWVPGATEATTVCTVDTDTRFNDVIADPEGRVFCGTMPGENSLGSLYRLEGNGEMTVVVEDVDIPNGMGFTSDLETFYFTESEARRIYAFDYDRKTGRIDDMRTFLETQSGDGVPDGLTVDAADHIWSARWNGGRVVRYDSDGTASEEISIPARKVSSVTFGGPDYRDLYLTTALDGGDRAEEGKGAGALFRVPDVGVSGRPEFRSRIALG